MRTLAALAGLAVLELLASGPIYAQSAGPRAFAAAAKDIRRKIRLLVSIPALVLLVCTTVLPGSASALSVKAVSVEEILGNSVLVMEGQVTALESRLVEGTRLIQTCVRIEIAEIVKGRFPAESIELCFLGGTFEDVTMRVAGMRYPELGETGIYFVESLDRLQVHPLFGGPQGHFLVVHDPATDEERVLTSDERPVVGVISSSGQVTSGLGIGAARGVLTADPPGFSNAMTKGDFKQSLRAILDELTP